jgi:hypothetical protein
MSVVLAFSAVPTPDNTGLILTDNTGQYTVNTIGGWESPNPPLSSALTATILVENRNQNGVWVASPAGYVSVFPTFPSETFGTLTLLASTVGYGGTGAIFTDGIYRITYTVTGTYLTVPYTYTVQIIYYQTGTIACCYQQYALAVSTCNCVCDDVTKQLYNIALYNRVLQLAISLPSPNLTQIQTFINQLTALCSNCAGCSAGCGGC